MSIKIHQIEAEALGPLSDFKEEFAPVTLIYGQNEKGKTFLVELILTSLFKNLAGFKNEFRVKKPKGRVIVAGLEDDPVIFSPKSKNKLDSIWDEHGQGMPPNIARLLVVKGGETEIDKSANGGIGRNAIREFLSSQEILEAIQENITLKGTRDAQIEGGDIFGANSGDIKKRREAQEERNNIVRLIERINHELSDGDVIALEKEITLLKEKMDTLESAKKHAAYLLSQKKQTIESEIQRFENANFNLLNENFSNYLRIQASLDQKISEKEEEIRKSKHYLWLKAAVEEYQKHFSQTSPVTGPTFLIIAFVLLVIAVLLIVIGQNWPSIIAIIAATGFGFWHSQKAKQSQISHAEITEIENIRVTYNENFKEPCKDLATMRVKLDAITSSYHASQQIEKDIEKANQEIKNLEFEIQQSLKDIGKGTLPSTDWEKTITQLRHDLTDLDQQKQEVITDIARYDVDPSDYVEEDPGVEYKRDLYDDAETKKEMLIETLGELEQSLQNLKSEIQGIIGDHSLTDWGELIHKLRELKLEIVQQYKNYTTEILAGNILHQIIEQNQEQEDEKILKNLDSDIVKKPLAQISENYIGVEIDDEIFKVIDKYNQKFDFKDLSTGAREQIFLALRIGFAKKVMQGNSAFLIFDDAFQHSDWNRRPRLVDTMFELAKQGWQIIYFSMDDNIRDLFEKTGKKAQKGLYARINL
jgi:uncharacterized protein YhaN